MKCCFGYQLIYKPATHLVAGFALWTFVLVLLSVENGEDLTKRLDLLHTYQLQKYPLDYDSAMTIIKNSFQNNWDDTCMALTSFANQTACATKRAKMVTDTRSALGCDQYRSPSCNCVNQILRGINSDANAGSATTPNTVGALTTTGKSLAGYKDSLIYALDSCHYLHHNTQLAAESGTIHIRRTGMVFMLTTLVAGNLVSAFLVHASRWGKVVVAVGFPMLATFLVTGLETNGASLLYYISVPPFLLLAWAELLLPQMPRGPFVAPYFFGPILATLNVLALSENDVLDFDVIAMEVMKAHLVSLLYFGVGWFVAASEEDPDASKASYMKKPAQDSLYIAMLLAVGVTVQSALAPYTGVCYLSALWWLPTVFVAGGFLGVIWVGEMDRFSDFFHSEVNDRRARQKLELAGSAHHVRNGSLYLSGALLVLTAIVVSYAWNTYSLTYHSLYELVPSKTIQINSAYAWLAPTGFAA